MRALYDRLRRFAGSPEPASAVPRYCPLSVGDTLCVGGGTWEVRAVCLGALGQESVVEVRRLGYEPPTDSDGFPTLMHVPVQIIAALVESAPGCVVRR